MEALRSVRHPSCGSYGGTSGSPLSGVDRASDTSPSIEVKAHWDDKETVPEEHRKGNNLADEYAGQAVIEVTIGADSRVRRLDRQTRVMQEDDPGDFPVPQKGQAS